MYTLFMFDGLVIPPYLDSGDEQNMGTGNALTNFTQLAGGGFFDNYGTNRSPKGIRPITKRGVIWGTDAADSRRILDSWRQRIGTRGKLTVKFDDDTTRWQWARLQDVNTPRRADNKGYYIPVELSWVTADQSWRGITHDEDEWTWGDLSWYFGDGTATMGESDQTYTVTTSPLDTPLTNVGTATSTNLRITFTPDLDITLLNIQNLNNGHSVTMSGTTFPAGDEIVIDCGAMSVTVDGVDAYAYFTKNTSGLPWLPLGPGTGTMRLVYSGASGTLSAPVGYNWTDYYA